MDWVVASRARLRGIERHDVAMVFMNEVY